MYHYGKEEFKTLQRYVMYGAIPNNNELKANEYWINKVLSRIYKPGINFDQPVSYNYWWHGVETSAIACSLYMVNIVIFSLPSPRTLLFLYSDNNIDHKEILNKNDTEIMERYVENRYPTIYLIHCDGCHYKFYKKTVYLKFNLKT